jgi:hypothetical protein
MSATIVFYIVMISSSSFISLSQSNFIVNGTTECTFSPCTTLFTINNCNYIIGTYRYEYIETISCDENVGNKDLCCLKPGLRSLRLSFTLKEIITVIVIFIIFVIIVLWLTSLCTCIYYMKFSRRHHLTNNNDDIRYNQMMI